MTTRTRREDLNDCTRAACTIESLGRVIDEMETNGAGYALSIRIIKQCKQEQQRQLLRLDKYAAKLGAPYPTQ